MATQQPDLAEFYKLSRPKKKPCQIGFALTQLSEKEGVNLRAALSTSDGTITVGAIQQWLAAHKHEVSAPAIVSHRRKTCTCYDD